MTKKRWDDKTAIVVGGGMAGLLACRVLNDHVGRVILLERDTLRGDFGPRAGTPQGRHLHVLLLRGKQLLESMFPGFGEEVIAAGGMEIDQGAEILLFNKFGEWANRHPNGHTSLNASRPLFEEIIRRRVKALPGVDFHSQLEVTGLRWDEAKEQVIGVTTRQRGEQDEEAKGAEQTWDADLVLDASGRRSPLPGWLEEAGWEQPKESVVNAFTGYASRIYEIPEDFDGDWRWMITWNRPPDNPRSGHIYQIEGNRWQVSVMGMARQYPPTDEEGFLEFTKTLSHPAFYEVLKDAKPLTPISGYRDTHNLVRHYEKLSKWPKGLLALGDAVCSFNPSYGQGMTVAAQTAELLETHLVAPKSELASLGDAFRVALAQQNKGPWTIATGEEVRWPETEGAAATLSTKIQHAYIDKVAWLTTHSEFVAERYSGVVNLTRSIASLFHPFVLLAVLFWPMRLPPSDRLPPPPRRNEASPT